MTPRHPDLRPGSRRGSGKRNIFRMIYKLVPDPRPEGPAQPDLPVASDSAPARAAHRPAERRVRARRHGGAGRGVGGAAGGRGMTMPGVAMPWLVGYYGVFQAGHVVLNDRGLGTASRRVRRAERRVDSARPPVRGGRSRRAGGGRRDIMAMRRRVSPMGRAHRDGGRSGATPAGRWQVARTAANRRPLPAGCAVRTSPGRPTRCRRQPRSPRRVATGYRRPSTGLALQRQTAAALHRCRRTETVVGSSAVRNGSCRQRWPDAPAAPSPSASRPSASDVPGPRSCSTRLGG